MSVELKLPDLELGLDAGIVQENLHAVQAIYFAYALEELRLDEVVERIAALFQQGLLPLAKGAAAQALIDQAANGDRLSDHERADLYARAFGAPGGETTEPQVNRAFDDLWLRFVSSVSAFVRQNGVDTLLRPASSASNAHVRCAARDLALNLSKHAFGLNTLAARLERTRAAQLTLLGEPDIQRAFGANDAWDVVERVNRDYLGGPVNVLRARTRAQSGAAILGWLADRADAVVRDPAGGSAPGNRDLLNSAEAWLAATGVSDEAVEHYAQPVESPPTERPPGKLPTIVAEALLEVLGLHAGAAAGQVGGECAAGFSALFRGAPGTGKTLAAQALASALSRELLRVDLSQVVSKSVGETEKNLDTIFDRAGTSGAILLFDEADALLGKRSAIKDAHDRYANIDIAHLLQRIEAHRVRGGIVIIESRTDDAAIDDGVLDRLRAVVRFPHRARS